MKQFDELLHIVSRLRSEQGCAWDRAQTLDTLRSFFLEEIYECIDAIDAKNIVSIEEELGDLLFLVVFAIQICKDGYNSSCPQIIQRVNEKLVTRHPHVFTSKKIASRSQIVKKWIAEKSKSKKRKTVAERIPRSAPALLMAHIMHKERKYLEKSASNKSLFMKIEQYLKRLHRRFCPEQVGNIMLELTLLAAKYNLELESVLRKKVLSEAKLLHYTNNVERQ